MEEVEKVSMELDLMTKTSTLSMKHSVYLWPMLVKTPMEASSLSLSHPLLGWMEDMLFSED